jgi:hypothetical protein
VAVLALIGIAFWLVRRFAGNRLGANPNRGRMPRLAVIDAAAVDGRRRLVLVRRDNTEHLLMIGGPTDIVVESNIVRASSAREQMPQRPGMPGAIAPEPPRIAPLPDTTWSEAEAARAETFEAQEPQMPEPPPRPARPSFAEELRRPAPMAPERRAEPLTSFAPEPLAGRAEPRVETRAEPRADPVLPRMPSRAEPSMPRPTRPVEAPKPIRSVERAAVVPPPPPAAPPAPAPTQSADQNLAEMAQRLEAALRRPVAGAPTADTAPPVAPEPPVRDRSAARSEPPSAPAPGAPAAPAKTSFENLEDEMASLLGRPKSSSS